jgi:hypothetical protein
MSRLAQSKDLHLRIRADQLLRRVPRITEVNHCRIGFPNQRKLLRAAPSLELLLPGDCGDGVCISLDSDRTGAVAIRRKSIVKFRFVLEDPLVNIVRAKELS